MSINPFYRYRANKIAWIAFVVIAIGLMVSCLPFTKAAIDSPQADDLLTIDGFGVSEQEFQLFLADERALTANTFHQQYGADADAGFWDREYDGQTPMEHARRNALRKLTTAKMETLIAVEHKLIDQDIRFDAIMKERNADNDERSRKRQAGEVSYGLSTYDEFQYYQYVRNNVWSALIKWYASQMKPTDEELNRIYEQNKEMFTRGVKLEYMLLRQDGSTEVLSRTENDIPKSDSQALSLWHELDGLVIGEQLKQVEYGGESINVLLMSRIELGIKPISEVKDFVLQLYAEDRLRLIVQERVDGADIRINTQKLNAIRFTDI